MMFTTRTFCVCVSNPNLSCQFPSQSPFLWAFADTVHHNEKLIISSSPWDSIKKKKFPPLFFDWRIIALQYFAGFRHTATWISHKNQPQIDICPSPLNPLSSPSPSTPVLSQSSGLSSQQIPTWYLFHIW